MHPLVNNSCFEKKKVERKKLHTIPYPEIRMFGLEALKFDLFQTLALFTDILSKHQNPEMEVAERKRVY
jgi:hypothetical protein